MARLKTCEKCGTPNLEWRRARSGRYVLWSTGSMPEPHFLTCEQIQASGHTAPVNHTGAQLGTLNGQPVYDGQEIELENEQVMSDESFNQAMQSPVYAFAAASSILVHRDGDHERLEDMIATDKPLIVDALNSLLTQTAVKLAPAPRHTIEAPSGHMFKVDVKPGQTVSDALKNNPVTVTPETPKPAKVTVTPNPTPNGELRNVPCPTCGIPNRSTYSELIRGVACFHCLNR